MSMDGIRTSSNQSMSVCPLFGGFYAYTWLCTYPEGLSRIWEAIPGEVLIFLLLISTFTTVISSLYFTMHFARYNSRGTNIKYSMPP